MSLRNKQSGDSGAAVLDVLPGGVASRRSFVAAAIVIGLVVILGVVVWGRVRDHVLSQREYRLDPEQIVVTPTPPWIRADVRAEVLRDAGGGLSVLDRELTVRMASAFAAHPWVAQVEHVSKHYPARLDVALVYRKPVAMVEVREGVLPVDEAGYLLPTDDFSPQDAEKYPRISGVQTAPAGPAGTRWGDTAVVGAAQIVAALAQDWQALGLFRVVPAGRKPSRQGGAEYTYTILTRGGSTIDWGRAPSSDNGEVPASEKIAQLRRLAEQNHGKLDGPRGPHQIVIHPNGELVAEPRVPKPLPKEEQ